MKNVKEGHSRPVVCLDAGHYGKYNQSPVVPEYYESEMNWKLHLMLRDRLVEKGMEVRLTRQNQETDLNEYNRGLAAEGADLFLSIHSNAAERESADHPVVYVPLDGSGTELGKRFGACIRNVMDTDEPERIADRKGNNGDYYGVIRGATAVGTTGLILEHSFHTNRRATQWLMVEENLKAMAEAEAKLLADWFGLEAEQPHWYRIRKSWEDAASQTAAYYSLDGAIKACPVGYSVYDGAGEAVYTHFPPEVYRLELPVLGMGSRSGLVKATQLLLSGRGFPCDADGIFGEETKGAVTAWQNSCGLEPNGRLDQSTVAALLGMEEGS